MDTDRFDRIDEKLDRVVDRLTSIEVTLGKQQSSLDEHVRRTDLLEERVEAFAVTMQPIQDHVAMVAALAKIFAVLAALVAVAAGVKELIG